MEVAKKCFFMMVLALVVCGASFFMVTESAEFYARFYPDGSWRGLYLAGLLEAFLLIMAVIRIGGRWDRFLTGGVMAGLFCVIIFAAGMQAIGPILETMGREGARNRLVAVLNQELATLDRDFTTFERARQKGNLAVTALQKRKIYKELKTASGQPGAKETGLAGQVQIGLLLTIRFLVQLANLLCARGIGILYRMKSAETGRRQGAATRPPTREAKDSPDPVLLPAQGALVAAGAPAAGTPVTAESAGTGNGGRPPVRIHNKENVLSTYPGAVCTKSETGYRVTLGGRVLAEAAIAPIAWRKASVSLFNGTALPR